MGLAPRRRGRLGGNPMHEETRRFPCGGRPRCCDKEVVRRVAGRRGGLPKAESEAALECSCSRRGRQVTPRIWERKGCRLLGANASRLFELAPVLVRRDHVARFIVNANHSIM